MKNAARYFTPALLACSLMIAYPAVHAQSAETQLNQRLDALANELERVKAELKRLKEQPQPVPSATAAVAPGSANTAAAPQTQLTAYGEIAYTRPSRDTSATQTTVGRFVTGFQHRFDQRTKVVAELEVENAVASRGDDGEVAVEQVYIEHRLNDTLGLRAGLFLMPLGLLNQVHEPPRYYGVHRNFVETAIIPTTLREVGLQVFGEHDNGISWSSGISTGPDLGKWDATSTDGIESPLGAIHQEGQFAKSKDLSWFGAVDWRGLPGVRVGAGVVTGKIGHGAADFAGNSARYTLWDAHAQWTPGPWDFAAVYAKGTISGAGELNARFAGAASLVPKSFDGWYLQGAYKLRLNGDYVLAPFARYEQFNTGSSFDGVVAGLNPASYDTEGVTTAGVNFYLNPNVVFKADVQRFKVAKDSNRFNLGLGFAF